MKNFFYFLFGSIVTWLVAWVFAERIVEIKHSTKESVRKTKRPIFGVYKNQGKIFVNPNEASFIPENETIFQYPRKAELEAIPGIKTEEVYIQCFKEYVIKRKFTNPEAWEEFQKDYPHLLPRKDEKDIKLQLDKTKRAFYSAMNRQRKKLTKKI